MNPSHSIKDKTSILTPLLIILAVAATIPASAQERMPVENFPEYYAVEIVGEGPTLQRRIVGYDVDTQSKIIVSGAVSISDSSSTSLLFEKTRLYWEGSGPAELFVEGTVFSILPGESAASTLTERPISELRFDSLVKTGTDTYVYFVDSGTNNVRRINIATNSIEFVAYASSAATFDESTYTIFAGSMVPTERKVTLWRQSVVDDSRQIFGTFDLPGTLSSQPGRGSENHLYSVLPYDDDEVIIKVLELSIDRGFPTPTNAYAFHRVNYFTGEITELTVLPQSEAGRAFLQNVIGYTGSSYIIPPPDTDEKGSFAPYIQFIDADSLELVDGAVIGFEWDFHTFGRIFYSEPSTVNLGNGRTATGFLAREFSSDFSSFNETLFLVTASDEDPCIQYRGGGHLLPPFVDMNRINGSTFLYLSSEGLLEIDRETGNRQFLQSFDEEQRLIIGSGSL